VACYIMGALLRKLVSLRPLSTQEVSCIGAASRGRPPRSVQAGCFPGVASVLGRCVAWPPRALSSRSSATFPWLRRWSQSHWALGT